MAARRSTTNGILANLDITFIDCKFIYQRLESDNSQNSGGLTQLFEVAGRQLDKLSGTERDRYEHCSFYPGDKNGIKKQISSFELGTIKYSFIRCKFVKRDSRILENLLRKFKRVLGIRFDLNYVTRAAEFEGRKFKIKDIPDITKAVVKRIQEDD